MRSFAPLLFLVLVPGCARHAKPVEPYIPPIDLAGPTCCEHGPSVQVLRAWKKRCGKGDQCAVLDLRVQNPTARPLLFLLDGRDPFAGYLEHIEIQHANRYFHSETPTLRSEGIPVWAFVGQYYAEAIRLPPGADITLHNVGYFLTFDEFHVAFIDRVMLNHTRYVDWEPTRALTPLRGDFDMAWLEGTDFNEGAPLYKLDGKELASVDTWCTQRVAVVYEK